jgi:predicted methyltransferase
MIRTLLRTTLIVSSLALGIAAGAQSTSGDLAAVLADPARPEADKVRDADRKPAELIAFAGVKRGSTVAELGPGGGYFTRILTGAVGPSGHVYAMAGRPSPALEELAKTAPALSIVAVQTGEIKVPAPVDVVWTTLNYHDFKNAKVGDSDVAALLNKSAFAALKPGGIYLVVDHQAAPGTGTTATSTLHRIEDAAVKREVEAAGFKFDAESSMLRHPQDDYAVGVHNSERGKTDQFVLRFRKPE